MDEQAIRIRENMASLMDQALESGDFDLWEEIFEDRDPFEFI